MKRFVDGQEVELGPTEARVTRFGDRLYVRMEDGVHTAVAVRSGDATYISYRGRQYVVEWRSAGKVSAGEQGSGEIRAPMPGQIVDVRVEENEPVRKGAVIVVLEAMKTQQSLASPFDGIVKSVAIQVGDTVNEGQILANVVMAADS